MNLSGAGVVKTSDNKDEAQELIEWLATKGQDDMIDGNHEFPVNDAVQPDEIARPSVSSSRCRSTPRRTAP